MDLNNFQKIKIAALKISFLMPHQGVVSDLKDIAKDLRPNDENIDRQSPEYLLGASEALQALISALQEKGD